MFHIYTYYIDISIQGWILDGTSPQDFFPWDLNPKAQNPRTVPRIFVPVQRVPRICVPWDDFGTTRILGTAWELSPRDSPGISEFFEKHDLLIMNATHFFKMNPYCTQIIFLMKYKNIINLQIKKRSHEATRGHLSSLILNEVLI